MSTIHTTPNWLLKKSSGYLMQQLKIGIGNSTVSKGIRDKYLKRYFKIHQNTVSRAAAATSDIWGVFKYHEPVFIPSTLKKPCCFLFILQGKEISHFT